MLVVSKKEYFVKKKTIKTNWDYTVLAKNYDLRADYSKILIKKILKRIKCQKNYPVADIGAGTGKLTKVLCENNLIVHAVEPNQNMRFYGEKNTKNFMNINWSIGTGENSKLNSSSIYCVFFGSSFNVVNYKKTLREIKRVLIKNGYFCCIWNHRNLKNLHQKRIEKIILKSIPNYKYGDRRVDYKKILEKENSLTRVLKITEKFNAKIKKNSFIKAWKSHGTLMRNCKDINQFNKIINEITKYINSINKDYVKVPYENVAYIARLK